MWMIKIKKEKVKHATTPVRSGKIEVKSLVGEKVVCCCIATHRVKLFLSWRARRCLKQAGEH